MGLCKGELIPAVKQLAFGEYLFCLSACLNAAHGAYSWKQTNQNFWNKLFLLGLPWTVGIPLQQQPENYKPISRQIRIKIK
ncbi:MAG: hypothetical protein COW03_02745 [Cytophagales bacterium CG12_big_fil_rev_8_21_14_0_65_40_12]|nr:MAG: hypothetical protein COW03_02745 [Cytophagales bacterium CG12_big_fil_rev_8_21_14_0_65_40_12]PIW03462.1 MAG: hypothetical protein COW40_14990 [Cytophagales bacterium CG17_big_fil_post_rev_8_21_14_2_50_40_13]